ncbi:MAG TPA: J domain-containing protein [Holophagaceae bacterium]|nr:J domain-containing protein [Holophagaceae bacterium]
MNPKPRTSHSHRGWEVSFAHGELLVWIRFGGLSLWLDTATNRLEVNGQSLWGWMGRRDPVEALQGLPLRVQGPAPEARLVARIHALGASQARSGLLGWVWLLGLGVAVLAANPGWPLRVAGCAAGVLGSRLRGGVGVGFGALVLLMAQQAGVPAWGLPVAGLLLLLSQGLGQRRLVYPIAAALVLAPRDPAFSPVWVGLAVAAGAWALRPRRLEWGLSGEAAWIYHSQAEAFGGVPDPELWSLDLADPMGLPPAPASGRRSRWRVEGRTPVASLGDDRQRWVFFPGAVAVVQEGVEVRLHALSELAFEGRACAWEAGPPGLGGEAWILALGLGADRLTLLFGAAETGRAFQARIAAWARAEAPPEPRAQGPRAEALALLGLGPDAAEAAIRSAYHREVRRVHPDHHPQATPEERRALEARLRALNEAMALLRQPAA